MILVSSRYGLSITYCGLESQLHLGKKIELIYSKLNVLSTENYLADIRARYQAFHLWTAAFFLLFCFVFVV